MADRATEDRLKALLKTLGAELDKRAKQAELLDCYYDGDHPYPDPVKTLKVTRAYRRLMEMSKANWPRLIVDSCGERLSVNGIKMGGGGKLLDVEAWGAWQHSSLDLGADLVHTQALCNKSSYVIVWPDDDGKVEIVPEHASTTIVQYAAGSLFRRSAAMRRWRDDDGRWRANLFLPDAIWKFRSKIEGSYSPAPSSVDDWELLEDGYIENPWGKVPVVEFIANPRLRPKAFGMLQGLGEFEDQTGHIDRLNFTTFSWLVSMVSMGFDLHVVIGDEIAYDDEGNALPAFERTADRVVQFEDPNTKVINVPGTDLKNYELTTEAFVRQLAAITKTPAHYLTGDMVNLSADAIRAAEAGLISKVYDHQRSFGESWEEVMRLATMMDDGASDELRAAAEDPSTEIEWVNPESRSLAEQADAASKLAAILPWRGIMETVFDFTPQQINAYESLRDADAIDLFAAGESVPGQ